MNKLTRIEELARKLNQEILALEVVQEYQKYEKLVLNDEKLKQLEKELKVLQKKIVNQKAKQDDRVTKTIQEYQEKKAYYENHPLVGQKPCRVSRPQARCGFIQ